MEEEEEEEEKKQTGNIAIIGWGLVILDETRKIYFHLGKSANDGRMIGYTEKTVAEFWWTEPDDFNMFEEGVVFPVWYDFIASRANELCDLVGMLIPISFLINGERKPDILPNVARDVASKILRNEVSTGTSLEETVIRKFAIRVPIGPEVCKHMRAMDATVVEPALKTKVFIHCEDAGDGYVFGGIDLIVCVHISVIRVKKRVQEREFMSTVGTITYVAAEALHTEDFYERAIIDKEMCDGRRFLLQGNPITFDKNDYLHRFDGKPLTDNIIHSAILNMPSIKYEPEDGDMSSPFFVFSSFFMSKLKTGITGRSGLAAKIRHNYMTYLKDWATVKNKEGNRVSILLDREFIFIPYNCNDMHWVLYVVYMPYAKYKVHPDAPDGQYNGSGGAQVPYLFVLDSKTDLMPPDEARHLHELNATCLKYYFGLIFESIYGPRQAPVLNMTNNNNNNSRQNNNSIRGVVECLVPQQNDSSNCGVYMLFFLAYMTKSASIRVNVVKRATSGNRVFTGLVHDIVIEFRKRIVSNVTSRAEVQVIS